MTRILVTGASGFIGKAVGAVLQSQADVRGAVRRLPVAEALPAGIEPVCVGEITGATDWTDALADVETVVHLAARCHVLHETDPDPLAAFRRVNVEGTAHLAHSAAQAGVKRLIFASSIGVMGDATDGPGVPPTHAFREADAPHPHDLYTRSKWEAEQELHRIAEATGLEVVITRLPLVYGPGVKGNFLELLRLVYRQSPLPLASARNRRSLLGLDNLADFVSHAVTHPNAAGETFHLSDGDDQSTPDMIRHLARGMERSARLVPVPIAPLRVAARLLGKERAINQLFGSLVVDSQKARRLLDWMPPLKAEDGLHRAARWYVQQYAA